MHCHDWSNHKNNVKRDKLNLMLKRWKIISIQNFDENFKREKWIKSKRMVIF